MTTEPRTHDAASATETLGEVLGAPPALTPPPPPPPAAETPTSRVEGARRGRGLVVFAAVVGTLVVFGLGGLAAWTALHHSGADDVESDAPPRDARRVTKKTPPAPCAEGDLAACTARCADGSGASCARLGEMYEKGRGVARDYAKAVDAFSNGCDRGDGRACSRLGGLYQTGKGTRVDYVASVRLIRKACDLGYAFSCAWLAWKGEGEPRDLAKAERLFAKACVDEDLRACTWQGEMRQMGQGIASPDPDGARALFRRGCDGGEAYSCWRLGESLLFRSGDPALAREAIDLVRGACAADVQGACDDLRALGLAAATP